MKKIILLFFLVIIPFFCIGSNVFAVTETSGDLQISWDDPLFSSSTIWYPGLTVEKSFTVKNLGGGIHTVSLKADNTSQTGDLANNIYFRVDELAINRYGGVNNKTLKIFWDNGEVNLSDIDGGNTTTYSIAITMPTSLGNEFQQKQAKFDLIVGFVGTPSQVTISGGDDGAVGGAATIVCTKPGSAPVLQSAIAGVNSVTLFWSEAADPVSYYLVAYGISPNNSTYGNSNVGGKGTTSYTVTNLSGGTSYCFIVRAGNGCGPGDFSNQICTTPFGGFLAGAVALDFAPGVLGVATPSAQFTSTPSRALGQIKGTESVIPICKTCIWWQFLLAEIIALIIYYLIILKKAGKLTTKQQIISISIPFVTYVVFYFFNRSCFQNIFFNNSQIFFCKYFIILDFIVYLLISLYYRYKLHQLKK